MTLYCLPPWAIEPGPLAPEAFRFLWALVRFVRSEQASGMEAGLALVSIAVVISTEHLQIFLCALPAGPDWLDVIDLQMLFAPTDSLDSWIFELAAMISLQNMFSHRDIDSLGCRFWLRPSFGLLLDHFVCEIFKSLAPFSTAIPTFKNSVQQPTFPDVPRVGF